MVTISPAPDPVVSASAAKAAAAPTLGFGALWAGDLAAWVKIWGGPPSFGNHFRLWFNQSGVRATLLLRLAQAAKSARIPVLPGVLSRLNLTLHGLDVPPSVTIGPGLYVPHPVGTTVMARSLGANVSLIACITVGMRNEAQFPIIGDNVFVGAGARILGGITVGEGAQIGANAVVVKDVPAGRTAVGIPARLLPEASATSTETEAAQ